MSKRCSGKPGEMSDECSPVILRLERARLDRRGNQSLTPPEWELLQAFGLGTLAAVRQRMDERAMLAAYDGAPSALSEFTTERLPDSAARERVPCGEQMLSQPKFEDFVETTLEFDSERLRVTIQCTVTRCLREREEGTAPRRDPEACFYAVAFDTRDGGVILRECGAVPRTSGVPVARSQVVREFVPQSAR